jgi:hypothetical protein
MSKVVVNPQKGGSEANAEWGLVLFATTGGGVRCVQLKMDWRAIKIRGLRDKLDQWAVFLYSWISLTRFFF